MQQYTMAEADPQRKNRLTWRKRQEFTLCVIGYVVGMGNVVYFPHLAYKNGGVVFLIPYLIMVMVVGLPMMMLEISLGQFCSRGVTECWEFSKIFSGIGWMVVFTSGMGSLDYNMLVAWAIYYFGATFTFFKEKDGKLPWAVCNKNDSWLSDFSLCRLNMSFPENATLPGLCTFLNYTDGGNGVCYKDGKPYAYTDRSLARENETLNPIPISVDFFRKVVNKKAETADAFGPLDPALVGCMFAAWTLVFLGVCRGIRSIGKIVYVTVTVPFVILLIMIGYGAFLPNATDCLSQYLVPRFDRLSDISVWMDAASQALFSLSVGAGGLITLSAYNEFSNNTFKNTLLIVGVDTLTALVATVTVFMYLGVLSHDEHLGTCEFIKNDDGLLTYMLFPYAFTKLPAAPAWSALFFLMMTMLGVDTQIAATEVVIEAIIVTWERKFKRRLRGVQFYVCFFFFLCGLPLASTSGLYWYETLSAFSWKQFVVVFLLCASISWVYGAGRFIKDIELMIGDRQWCCEWRKIGYVLEPLWMFVIPLGSLVLFVYMLNSTEHMGVWWLDVLAWCIPVCSILPIPITAVVVIVKAPGETLMEKVRCAFRPIREWGPNLLEHRERVDYAPGFVINPEEDEIPRGLRLAPVGHANAAFVEI